MPASSAHSPAAPRHDGDPVRRAVTTATTHPVVTTLVVIGIALAIAFSIYVGLDLFFTIPILVMIGVVAWGLHWLWRRRRPAEPSLSNAAAGRVGFAAVAIGAVLTFGAIQLAPYGRSHSNPSGTGEPQWASARTRELMKDACYSCHSNEVHYPPYASIAPISWMVQRHVDEAREKVNYSNFATDPGEAENTIEVIENGEMPPSYFTRFGLHSEAKLTDAQRKELIDGLRATPGMSEGGGQRRDGGRGDGD